MGLLISASSGGGFGAFDVSLEGFSGDLVVMNKSVLYLEEL